MRFDSILLHSMKNGCQEFRGYCGSTEYAQFHCHNSHSHSHSCHSVTAVTSLLSRVTELLPRCHSMRLLLNMCENTVKRYLSEMKPTYTSIVCCRGFACSPPSWVTPHAITKLTCDTYPSMGWIILCYNFDMRTFSLFFCALTKCNR